MSKESKKETALTVLVDKGYAVAQYQPEDLRAMIEENMGGTLTAQDLSRIRVPAGGGKSWEVADENGEIQSVKTISGVIILARSQRAYWAEDFSGGSEPPDCASMDGKTGMGNPGGVCADCPFDEWGSAGHSKACKEMRLLFLLRPGMLLPDVVVLSPASLGAWRKYATLLTGRGKAISSMVTEVGLREAVSKGGIKYAQATLKATDALDADSAAWLREYAAGMAGAFSAQAATINRDEVEV